MFGDRFILDARDEFRAAHRFIDIVEREPEDNAEVIGHASARLQPGMSALLPVYSKWVGPDCRQSRPAAVK